MVLKKIMRAAKKGARKIRGKAIKRYFNKGYKPKMGQIMSDVARLKKMVNAEKKVTDVTPVQQGLGLFDAGVNVDGVYTADITPVVTQNVTRSGRIGNSIKLHTACLDVRLEQDVGAVTNFKYVGYLVRRYDAQVALTASQIKDQMWEINPFTSVRDINSNRDPESGLSGYQIVKKFSGYMPMDSLSGIAQFRHHKIPLKLGFHLRYNNDTSTKVEKNQLCLIIFSSVGNRSTNDRLLVKSNIRYYYYDN